LDSVQFSLTGYKQLEMWRWAAIAKAEVARSVAQRDFVPE